MQPSLLPLLLGGETTSSATVTIEHNIVFGRIELCPSVKGVIVMRRFIYMNEDNDIMWRKMQTRDGTVINDATVSVAIKSSAGTSIATASLDYVTGSDGNYEGTIPSTDVDTLVEGSTYYVELTAVSGNYNGFRRVDVRAAYHEEVP